MVMTKEQSEAEDALARVLAMAYGKAIGNEFVTILIARDEKILRNFMFGSEKNKGE